MAAKNRPAFEISVPKMSNPNSIEIEEIVDTVPETKVLEVVPKTKPVEVITETEKPQIFSKKAPEIDKHTTINTKPTPIKPSTGEYNHTVEHFVRIPKLEVSDKKSDFFRVNYPVRETIQEDIVKLSKKSRISANLIVEYILEDYLFDDKFQNIDKKQLFEYGKIVKYDESGLNINKRKDLQLTIPTFYVDKIAKIVEELNEKYGLSLDKGNLVDILLEASISNS